MFQASGQSISTEAREAVDAIQHDLRSAFTIRSFYASEDGSDDGSGDDGGDDGGDGDQGDKGDTGSTGDVKDPDKKRLSDEAAANRVAARTAARERDEALTKLKALEDKDKDELDIAKRDLGETTTKLEEATHEVAKLRVENATLKAAGKHDFQDVNDAVRIALADANIKGDEDNLETLITEALDRTAKDKKYLLKSSNTDDNEDESAPPSGQSTNGKKATRKGLDEQALLSKFPALRR